MQGDRKRIVERLRADYGKLPVARIERRHIKALMARLADMLKAANNLLKVLRFLLKHCGRFRDDRGKPAVGSSATSILAMDFPPGGSRNSVGACDRHQAAVALESLLGAEKDGVTSSASAGSMSTAKSRPAPVQDGTPRAFRSRPSWREALASIRCGNLNSCSMIGADHSTHGLRHVVRRRCTAAGLVAAR